MSFERMKEPELRKIAESFGVDLTNVKGVPDVLAVMAEEGVTYDQWEAMQEIERVEPEELLDADRVVVVEVEKPAKRRKAPDEVLVKMTRNNYHFEIFGKVFTKEHPFVVMTEEEAQRIFDAEEGFTLAQPREAQEYYS